MKLTRAFIYILSNKNKTTFYVGMTNDLERRIKEHRTGEGSIFTGKYKLFELVYFEVCADTKQLLKERNN